MPVPRVRLPRAAAGLLPLSAAIVLTLTGCSTDQSPAADPARGCESRSSVRADDVRPIDLALPQVTVTAPGDGQLQVPAVAPRTDTPQRVTVSTASRETSVIGTDTDPPTTNVEEVSSALIVRAVCDDPTNAEFTFGEVTSPDTALDLATFDGATGGVSYSPGLAANSLRIFPPADAGDPASRAVEQSLLNAMAHSIPLPTEPIGAGARWRVERTITAATRVRQTIEATLKSWEGDRLTLEIILEENPVDPTFRIPGMSSTLDITRYSNSGTGTVTVDLRSFFPVDGSLTLTGARELVGADPNRPILQHTSFALAWQPTR
ncbi:hypothetical protein GOHSU_02_00360 [Gordonia hirsuta DSM 44140 = NBRC 16056]|uniref:Lipoprotein n=1 Tax=Gordonia hirsuta DSM 44140 = NBRC 16056 TaxID=1121927 RepID=L7L789_9ACTN|nr:hypothetical protein [Gordonia hirsuta]GAC55893.1 hypothetical protein GOHSU_02_00360 [Gordonia hirsuta DSM 44140 = NBRC 16056]